MEGNRKLFSRGSGLRWQAITGTVKSRSRLGMGNHGVNAMVDSTLQGYWWLPGGALDEDSVAGSLQISSRKLPVLTLMGTLDDDPTLLLGKAEHDVIIGVTE